MNYLGIDWGRRGRLFISDENIDVDFLLSFWIGCFYHFKSKENISTSKKFKEIMKKSETDKVLILVDDYSDYYEIELKLSKKVVCEFIVIRYSDLPRHFSVYNEKNFIIQKCNGIIDDFIIFAEMVNMNPAASELKVTKVSIGLLKMNLLFPN